MIKVIIILIIGGVLAGCSTPEQPKPACTFVAGMTIPVDSRLTVRGTEIVKVYKTGRRIDPNNPNIMHEAGEMYVISRSPTWNTRPKTPITDPSFNNHLKPVNIGMENLKKTNFIKKYKPGNAWSCRPNVKRSQKNPKIEYS